MNLKSQISNFKWRWILLAAALLYPALRTPQSAIGQQTPGYVYFAETNFTGAMMNRNVYISLPSGVTGIPFGTPITLTPQNGFSTNTLLPANYIVQFDGIDGSWILPVPQGTNIYNAWDLIQWGNIYEQPFTIASGTNTLFTTNWVNGFPIITLNANTPGGNTIFDPYGAATNFGLIIGANGSNNTASAVGALGTASSNLSLSIGANGSNNTALSVGALGTASSNLSLTIGLNGSNNTTSAVGALGTASSNLSLSLGLNGSNNTASAVGTIGTANTNFTLSVAGNNTNFTLTIGANGTNFTLAIGLAGTNFTIAQIGALGTANTNFSLGIGAAGTNFTLAQIATLGTALTNYANGQGGAGAITTLGNNLTNFSLSVGGNGSNFSLSIGAANTNFSVAIGLANTNFTISQIATIGLAGTNFALSIGLAGTNFTLAQIGALGSASTNYTATQISTLQSSIGSSITTSNFSMPGLPVFINTQLALCFTNSKASVLSNGAFEQITSTLFSNRLTQCTVTNGSGTSWQAFNGASELNSISSGGPFGIYGDAGAGGPATAVPGIALYANGILVYGQIASTNITAQIAAMVNTYSNYVATTFVAANNGIATNLNLISSITISNSATGGGWSLVPQTGSTNLNFTLLGQPGPTMTLTLNRLTVPFYSGSGSGLTNASSSNLEPVAMMQVTNAAQGVALSNSVVMGANNTNESLLIGMQGSNNTASAIGTLGTALTNFANSIGLAGTNFSLTVGANGSNFTLTVAGNNTNFSLAIGLAGTNFTIAQVGALGTASSNFSLSLASANTNFSLSLGTALTNFANTIGLNGSNNTASVVGTLGTSVSNSVFTGALNIGSSQVVVNGGTNFFSFGTWTGVAGPFITNAGFSWNGIYATNTTTGAWVTNSGTAGSPIWNVNTNGGTAGSLSAVSILGTYSGTGGSGIAGNGANANGNAFHFTGTITLDNNPTSVQAAINAQTNNFGNVPASTTIGDIVTFGSRSNQLQDSRVTVSSLVTNLYTYTATNVVITSLVTNQNAINLWGATNNPGMNGLYTNDFLTINGLPVWTNIVAGSGWMLVSNQMSGLGLSHNKVGWTVSNSLTGFSYAFADAQLAASVPGNNYPIGGAIAPATSGWATNGNTAGLNVNGIVISDWLITTNAQTNIQPFQITQYPLANVNPMYLTISPNGFDSAGAFGLPYASMPNAILDSSNYSPRQVMFRVGPGINTNTPSSIFSTHFLNNLEGIPNLPTNATVFGDGNTVSIYQPTYNIANIEPYVLVNYGVTFENLSLPRVQWGLESGSVFLTNLTFINCTVQDVTHATDFHNVCFGLYARNSRFITQADTFVDLASGTIQDCLLDADASITANTPNVNNGLNCIWINVNNAGYGPISVIGGTMICSNGTTGTGPGIYTNACVRIDTNTCPVFLYGPKLFHGNKNSVPDFAVWVNPATGTATNLNGFYWDNGTNITVTNGVFFVHP